MLLLPLALAGPLVVHRNALPLHNPSLLIDEAPANGLPDGWSWTMERGAFRVTPTRGPKGEPATRLAYTAGTRGSLCSAPTKVFSGTTVTLHTQVHGEAALGDVTAVHLHLAGPAGVVHTAKRRIDKGDHGWENVDILATVPNGANQAYACWEIKMVEDRLAGGLSFTPVELGTLEAESRSEVLPLKRIILVSIETFRRDHVHAYGYPRFTTPNLDAVIGEGTSFDRHYTHAPYTHPSLAALISSQLPHTLGFADNAPVSSMPIPTAAEYFASAGYVTAAFNVQFVLSNRYGLNRGFHYYRNQPNDTAASELHAELFPWLEEHGPDNLFLWLHYFEPHGPYRPRSRFRAAFDADEIARNDTAILRNSTDRAEGAPLIPNYVFDRGQFNRSHYVAGYDGDIATIDAELGQLFAFLRARGWDKDTLVAITADHGESMTDHGRYFCHGSLYEHDIHVPMVLWGPRIPAGRHVTARSGHVDVLPTLLEYAGLPVPEGFAGRSLRPLVENRESDRQPFTVAMRGKGEDARYAVLSDSALKLVVDATGAVTEVFDLTTDPGEQQNLAGLRPKDTRPIVTKFKKWWKSQPRAAEVVREQAMDEDDRERLRVLGYVE